MSAWTSRDVLYDPHPRYKRDRREGAPWDVLFEALADHYYRPRAPFTVALSACNGVIRLSGYPWWVPRRLAMRKVAAIAEKVGVGGDATFAVERCVLVDDSPVGKAGGAGDE